jgi:MFS family permease
VVIAGCALSAVSNGFTVLLIGRGLQGVGLGLLPVAMAIARRNLPPEAARRTIATLSVTTAIGAGLGYPLTGLIAQFLDFRAAYWFGAAGWRDQRSRHPGRGKIPRSAGYGFAASLVVSGLVLPDVGGFEVALIIAAALCLTTAVVSFVLPGRAPSPPNAVTIGAEPLASELKDDRP